MHFYPFYYQNVRINRLTDPEHLRKICHQQISPLWWHPGSCLRISGVRRSLSSWGRFWGPDSSKVRRKGRNRLPIRSRWSKVHQTVQIDEKETTGRKGQGGSQSLRKSLESLRNLGKEDRISWKKRWRRRNKKKGRSWKVS